MSPKVCTKTGYEPKGMHSMHKNGYAHFWILNLLNLPASSSSLRHSPTLFPANKTTMKFVRGVALLVATASRSTTTAFTVLPAASSSSVVAGSRFGAASVCQGELFTYQKVLYAHDRYEFEMQKLRLS